METPNLDDHLNFLHESDNIIECDMHQRNKEKEYITIEEIVVTKRGDYKRFYHNGRG